MGLVYFPDAGSGYLFFVEYMMYGLRCEKAASAL